MIENLLLPFPPAYTSTFKLFAVQQQTFSLVECNLAGSILLQHLSLM